MARQLASLSRRAVLRIASLTPFALLGFGSSSRAETGKYCDWLFQQECNIPVNSLKFQQVTNRLWEAFEEGAGGRGIKDEVFQKAFDMSGSHVICNFDKFPDNGEHTVTLNCCRRCGELAVEHAGIWPFRISADDFEEAWCETRKEWQEKSAVLPITGASGETGGMGC